jgi:hypothetical protein
MTMKEMALSIQSKLNIVDDTMYQTIMDVITEVMDFCNRDELPDVLEPFVRKKVKGIMDYEAVNGTGYHPEVASIKEGDGSITWAQTDGNTKASIYGLSDGDKAMLRRHRRLRGYD